MSMTMKRTHTKYMKRIPQPAMVTTMTTKRTHMRHLSRRVMNTIMTTMHTYMKLLSQRVMGTTMANTKRLVVRLTHLYNPSLCRSPRKPSWA
jgi:hypothetical protein